VGALRRRRARLAALVTVDLWGVCVVAYLAFGAGMWTAVVVRDGFHAREDLVMLFVTLVFWPTVLLATLDRR
jgi:hypothetical protein